MTLLAFHTADCCTLKMFCFPWQKCAVRMKVSVQENRLSLPYKDVKYVYTHTTFRMHSLTLNHQLIA